MVDRSHNTHCIMETDPQFDLNQSIQTWREGLAGSPAFRAADLDELESHMRDSVATLQIAGLSAEEAYWVARKRVGTLEALDGEFEKVNRQRVWLNRVMWMVAGCVVVGALTSFVSGLVGCATFGLYSVTKQVTLLGPASLVLHLALLFGLLAYLWRSGVQNEGMVWRTGAWIRNRPVAGAFVLLLLLVFTGAISTVPRILMAKVMPAATYSSLILWLWPVALLQPFLWPAFLVWLLIRTGRRPVTQ